MEIIKEQLDDLNAIVKIKLAPTDYSDRVETQMRKLQKTASIPGFRAGKVPAGMIKKMYGRSVLADEMNKILTDKLYDYLNEQNVDFLGNPLPKENGSEGDWENPSNFEFTYEVGLAPSIAINLSNVSAIPYYKVKVEQDMVDRYLADIRRRYGKFSNPETAETTDILYGQLVELNADLTAKEGGVSRTTTLSIEMLNKDEAAKFIGAKKEDSVVFNPLKAIDNVTERAAMLGVERDNVNDITSDFRFEISSVNRIEKAEYNQELFDKLYGAGEVTSEEQMMERVKADVENMFKADSERKLRKDVTEVLLNKINPSLPDDFLKRWIMKVNEKPITPEQLEKEYVDYAKGLRWRLIENTILKDEKISIEPDEIKEYVKGMILEQFAHYGQAQVDDATLDRLVNDYLTKEEQTRRVVENISGRKVFEYLKANLTLDVKELPYDEFAKIAYA